MLTHIEPKKMSVERFQHSLSKVCGAFQAEALPGSKQIIGSVYSEKRAGLEIAHIAKDLKAISRTRKDINQDSREHFFLVVQEEGNALMSQHETAHMLQPGDMMLIDSTIPSEFSFFGNFGRQLSVHLPRSEMFERFGKNTVGGVYLPRNDYITMALGATLAKAFEPTDNNNQSYCLREAMFGLIGAFIYDCSGKENVTNITMEIAGVDLLQRGTAFLDSEFRSNNLTILGASIELGTSLRQLQRAFEFMGTTPSDYLLQKRLGYACHLLRNRQNGTRKILVSSIAYAAGFNDVSYFNRQFRKYFKCAPGKYGS